MMKWGWTSLISFAAALAVGIAVVLLGAPKLVGSLVVFVYFAYRANNRPATKIASADRDQLLAQAAPANCGVVYVHRGLGVGGLVVGFNVKLDDADVALLNAARFTRLLVAPGSHRLVVGPGKLSTSIKRKQTATAHFAITAGETAVFGLKFAKGKMLRQLELDRESDVNAALAKLGQMKMVASAQPAGSTQISAAVPAQSGS